MTWSVWLPSFGAAASATVLAVSYYLHWACRFRGPKLLGQIAEISFLILILCLGLSAMGALWSHRP